MSATVCGCLWLTMAFEAASEKRLGESLKHLDTSWKYLKASWNVIKACFIKVLSYRHAQHTMFYRVRYTWKPFPIQLRYTASEANKNEKVTPDQPFELRKRTKTFGQALQDYLMYTA